MLACFHRLSIRNELFRSAAILLFVSSNFAGILLAGQQDGTSSVSGMSDFLQPYCADCHSTGSAEGGFELEQLQGSLDQRDTFSAWVKLHDRIESKEMPPVDAEQPSDKVRAATLEKLAGQLKSFNSRQQADQGRTQYRRLNRFEYEASLQDLLNLPNLEVAEMLPADTSAHGFDNVAEALDLSSIQMARYLAASRLAINQAIQLEQRPTTETRKVDAITNGRFAQVIRKASEALPIGQTSVGLFRQPNTAQAPWWWSKCDPPTDGIYRIRMKTFGLIWDRGKVLPADQTHVVTYQAVQQTTKRTLARKDIGRSERNASIHEFTAYLRQGDQIQIWFDTLDDRNKKKVPWEEYTAPGVAIEWLELEGPLLEEWPPASHQQLFGDLPIEDWTTKSGLAKPSLPMIVSGVGKRAIKVPAKRDRVTLKHVVSASPEADAERLLTNFAQKAFRRPVTDAQMAPILQLVQSRRDDRRCFQEAMKIGYQAILCSPDFLFLQEDPGQLDHQAIASRLSYFLWKSLPDDQLLALAAAGKLTDRNVLRQQTERLLNDARSKRFVNNFTDQWLDLRRITLTEPDEVLYPEYDSLLVPSMVQETQAYFTEMLRNDLSVAHVVDSEFAMVNERLAELYGLSHVDGVKIRKVSLPAESPRGGLLTQGSLLKVTANGTTTSPVTRGAWVLDRLYGQPASLPPANVEAVEPDLRGTTTIRKQLEKHRSVTSCASCHRRIDPPGFALESFDVIGGYRERYRSLERGDRAEALIRGSQPVRYKLGLLVDATGVAPDGRPFSGIQQFREILLDQQKQLARNLAQKLMVYATGAGIQFADRLAIEDILRETQATNYGLRSLVHTVVQSNQFLSK